MIAGRGACKLPDGALRFIDRWGTMVGLRVSLAPGVEQLAVDIDGQPALVWAGPGIAPMAVAAVFHLHGPAALLDHPGLAPLRAPADWPSPVSLSGPAGSRA